MKQLHWNHSVPIHPDWAIVGAPNPDEDAGGVMVLASTRLGYSELQVQLRAHLTRDYRLATPLRPEGPTVARLSLDEYEVIVADDYPTALIALFQSTWQPTTEEPLVIQASAVHVEGGHG